MFHAEFEATNHCNTRCLQCPHEAMSRPRGRLEWSTYRTVVDKIRTHVQGERFSLSFSGMGEPLLHPLLPQFIEHVSSEAFTAFATNGAALTPQNVGRLIEAGLDVLYVSFNGDEPALYEKMMGGIAFDRVLRNLRQAVALTRGARLRINANISVTRANRHRLTRIQDVLHEEGVSGITFSMCHTRGGNLRDPAVFDTPPIPAEVTHCDVIRGTLFIDWQGKVFICDHDIHGEHCLGDLMIEPIEAVLGRRAALVRDGMPFKICGECNDVLKMGFRIFPDDASGILPDWIYDVYRDDAGDALQDAGPHLKWLYRLYKNENRLDRMVGRLITRNQGLEQRMAETATAAREREKHFELNVQHQSETIAALTREKTALAERIAELDGIARRHETRIFQLDAERRSIRQQLMWPLVRLEKMIRRSLGGKPSGAI